MPTSWDHVWRANLGPRAELLRDAQAGKIGWGEFGRRYRKELFERGTIDQRNQTIKNHGQKSTLRLLRRLARRTTVMLMGHCAGDELRCHRRILQAMLERRV